MCPANENDRDAQGHDLASERLATIARLLDVPLAVFVSATDEPLTDASPAAPHAGLRELLTLYLTLAPEDRETLLAHAHALAGAEQPDAAGQTPK